MINCDVNNDYSKAQWHLGMTLMIVLWKLWMIGFGFQISVTGNCHKSILEAQEKEELIDIFESITHLFLQVCKRRDEEISHPRNGTTSMLSKHLHSQWNFGMVWKLNQSTQLVLLKARKHTRRNRSAPPSAFVKSNMLGSSCLITCWTLLQCAASFQQSMLFCWNLQRAKNLAKQSLLAGCFHCLEECLAKTVGTTLAFEENQTCKWRKKGHCEVRTKVCCLLQEIALKLNKTNSHVHVTAVKQARIKVYRSKQVCAQHVSD